MKFVYPAIFRQEQERVHVRFPDLEQCEAEGKTYEQALDNAKEAERNWIALELEENADLPRISAMTDLSLAENETVQNVAVTVRLMEGYDD